MGGKLEEGVVALTAEDAVAGRMIRCMLDWAFALIGRVDDLGACSILRKRILGN